MTVLEPDRWAHLPVPDKRILRDRMLEILAKNGIPIGESMTSPLQLSIDCDRTQVARPPLRLIDDALTWVHATPDAKLMVFAPPRAGKSNLISRWFPFWWLTRRPTDRIIVTSYASRLAETHGAACRDLVAAYGADFGLKLKADESTRADWTITAGGGVRSRGVRSGLVGQAMNVGLIDDPYADRAAADSPRIREGVWDWYSSAFSTRQAPGARQIITLTRWHLDDLAGRLLQREGRLEEGGEWKVVHLPALALPPDPERGIYDDPLDRAPGDPLPHPLIDENDLDALVDYWTKRKTGVTTRDWNALFQGTPFDSTGGLLTAQMIRDRIHDPAPARRAGVGVDPSGGGRDTAGIVGAQLGTDGKFTWVEDRTANMSSDQWPLVACRLAHDIDADVIVFESNYGGDQAKSLITQAWDRLQRDGEIPPNHFCPRVIGVHSRKNKFLRAEPIAQAVITERAWFGRHPSLRILQGEWEVWEPGSTWSPGALDAGVHLAYELLPAIGSGAQTHSVAKRKKSDATGTSAVSRRRRR